MQNEFEKKIKQRLEGLALTPADAVWENVASRIANEKKKRRMMFIWWTAVAILVAGVAGWFALAGDYSSKNAGNKFAHTPKPTNQFQSPGVNAPKSGATGEDLSQKSNVARGEKLPAKAGANLPELANNVDGNAVTGSSNKVVIDKQTNAGKVGSAFVKKQNLFAINNATRQLNKSKLVLPGSRSDRPVTLITKRVLDASEPPGRIRGINSPAMAVEGVRSAEQNAAAGVADSATSTGDQLTKSQHLQPKIDSSSLAQTQPKVSLAKTRKTAFGFTVLFGRSDNKTGLNILSSPLADNVFSSTPSNQNSGGVSAPAIERITYAAARSFGVGFFAQRHLGKSVSITASIQYHYYSATTMAGKKVMSQRNLYDTLLKAAVSVNEFYSLSAANGQIAGLSKFTNRYHFIQLPVNLQLQLLHIGNKPVLLTAGLTPGFIVGSAALYYNRYDRISYVDKRQFRTFQLSTQAGLAFGLINAKKFTLNLGPQLEYGLTNLSKSLYNTKQHLTFIGLKSNIVFLKL